MLIFSTINFYGIKEQGFQENTDVVDWIIASFIHANMQRNLYPKLTVNEKEYLCFSYSDLIEEIPFLGKYSKEFFRKKLNHLADEGVIERTERSGYPNAFRLTQRGANAMQHSNTTPNENEPPSNETGGVPTNENGGDSYDFVGGSKYIDNYNKYIKKEYINTNTYCQDSNESLTSDEKNINVPLEIPSQKPLPLTVKKSKYQQEAEELIEYYNSLKGHHPIKATENNTADIIRRLKEGNEVEACKALIFYKKEALKDEMEMYWTPISMFRKSNFYRFLESVKFKLQNEDFRKSLDISR